MFARLLGMSIISHGLRELPWVYVFTVTVEEFLGTRAPYLLVV